jgi:hypothetical protein
VEEAVRSRPGGETVCAAPYRDGGIAAVFMVGIILIKVLPCMG